MRKHINNYLPHSSLKQTPIATYMKIYLQREAIAAKLVICDVGGLPRLCSDTPLIGIFYILFRHLILNCIDVFKTITMIIKYHTCFLNLI